MAIRYDRVAGQPQETWGHQTNSAPHFPAGHHLAASCPWLWTQIMTPALYYKKPQPSSKGFPTLTVSSTRTSPAPPALYSFVFFPS